MIVVAFASPTTASTRVAPSCALPEPGQRADDLRRHPLRLQLSPGLSRVFGPVCLQHQYQLLRWLVYRLPATCGSSCTACPSPLNGRATCDGVSCDIACDPLAHECGQTCALDRSPTTGGSTNCNTRCPSSPNGVAVCPDGDQCTFQCDDGFTACTDGPFSASCGRSSYDFELLFPGLGPDGVGTPPVFLATSPVSNGGQNSLEMLVDIPQNAPRRGPSHWPPSAHLQRRQRRALAAHLAALLLHRWAGVSRGK